GQGSSETFADYSQWESWQQEREQATKSPARETERTAPSNKSGPAKKKLSYLEAREYTGIEKRVADAEQLVRIKQAQLEDPAIVSNASQLVTAQSELVAAQKDLETLYARWAELEEKN